MNRSADSARTTVDPAEVERFSRLAHEWWNPRGKFSVLHKLNPVRLRFIRDTAAGHYAREPEMLRPLEGLSLLDIGCGGGLLTEPLARLGAKATGIDPSEANVAAARAHAAGTGAEVTYRVTTAEALADEGLRFDIVIAMEVVEHVADIQLFFEGVGSLVKPGGLFFASTINRTARSFALAIIGAEYILGWIPRGTHRWSSLVRPEELDRAMRRADLERVARTGVAYDPLRDEWRIARDTAVNYMVAAHKPLRLARS